MKIANVKGMVAKGMVVVLAAGALMFASPAKAEAQRFAVGVRVGAPFYGPRVYAPGPFYGAGARFEFERREAFVRHDEWLRAHRFGRPYGYR
jgi:hypothetical protein